jgi:hypothetical protein
MRRAYALLKGRSKNRTHKHMATLEEEKERVDGLREELAREEDHVRQKADEEASKMEEEARRLREG